MRRYLLATDGSAAANQAARWLGEELAGERDVHVTVLHVVHPEPWHGWLGIDARALQPDMPVDEALAMECEPLFQAAREALGLPGEQVSTLFRVGPAAEGIASEVERGRYDALVLGRGSRGGRLHRHLSDLLIRSVRRPLIAVPESMVEGRMGAAARH